MSCATRRASRSPERGSRRGPTTPVGEQQYRFARLGWPLAPDPEGWYEQRIPAGRVDLVASSLSQSEYHPTEVENALLRPDEPLQVELVMTPSLDIELRLAPGQQPFPHDRRLFLVEGERRTLVYSREKDSWSDGSGERIHQGLVVFHGESVATVEGLAPGRFRFLVVPDDVVIEPGEVALGEGRNEPVLVRWAPR